MNKSHQQNQKHTPVLVAEVLRYLAPRSGESFLDVTAGYGGHSEAILERTLNPAQAVLVDRDEQAIRALNQRFKNRGAHILHDDFLAASQRLLSTGEKFDLILADLGLSSAQLDSADRGFAFNQPGPLDMRMDHRQKLTAEELVNRLDEAKLAEILKTYGEEPKARVIAARIVAARPLKNTGQLAQIVSGVWRSSRHHPATRTFQALRIAVNSELVQLDQSLPLWRDLLKPDGRLAVISFHSLEDRIVKRFLTENSNTYDAQLTVLTKRPITATASEVALNPRARSAKLRAASKIKTKRKDKDTS
jgi:16S rRNA (cytosine1402-N4)-methyltransferase